MIVSGVTPTFKENVIAFTEALGPDHPTFIVSLSAVPWPTPEARSEFLEGIGAGEARGEEA